MSVSLVGCDDEALHGRVGTVCFAVWVFRTAELSARTILLYALLLLRVLSSLEGIHKQIKVVATVY